MYQPHLFQGLLKGADFAVAADADREEDEIEMSD
tara:strand:- start:59 stop:160 length:102 start_codon:yes stop_codon:yes gene_type:complete